MNRLINISVLLFLLISADIFASDTGYFITFTDKTGTPYSITNPEKFLSARAVSRRKRQDIPVTATDLPVNPDYVNNLRELGITVKYTSKWMNGCIAFSSDAALMDTLDKYSYVKAVEVTYISTITGKAKLETERPEKKGAKADNVYGKTFDQINTVNGTALHDKGYMGEGMIIAIIDAGFKGVDHLPAFDHLWQNDQILGTKDFVNPGSNIFMEHSHGMNVLSIIGGKIDDTFLGTAPEADFWLLRTEDACSEYPIEADYWICAAEFADSAGVDVINTSLGYSEFDNSSMNYTYSQLDGNTLRISKAADIAAATGMIVVISAGNEGNKHWRNITAPADAKGVITVGAMTADSTKASFSSFGPTADGRTKPDLTAMGVSNAIQLTSGSIGTGSGTSFSAPVITGLMACLWQSLSDMTAKEVKELVLKSCNHYSSPDNSMGYGIPNFKTAYHTSSKSHAEIENDKWNVYPNPFVNQLVLTTKENIIVEKVEISLYDITGRLKYRETVSASPKIYLDIPSYLTGGMYILHIKENDVISQHKLVKNP